MASRHCDNPFSFLMVDSYREIRKLSRGEELIYGFLARSQLATGTPYENASERWHHSCYAFQGVFFQGNCDMLCKCL